MSSAKAYFEFSDAPHMKGRVWTVLREITKTKIPPPRADIVRLEEWSGMGTAAIENQHRKEAEGLKWSSGVNVQNHRSELESWGYRAADIQCDWDEPIGVRLVVDQHVEETDQSIWHIHPDLLIALDLVREGDSWFRPVEGWIEVIRLKYDAEGKPSLVEIRTEFLLDYLAARDMGLFCSSYRERVMVSKVNPDLSWPGGEWEEEVGGDRLECITTAANWLESEDYFFTRGALWRREWIDGGSLSTRIRNDPDPHAVTFALKADGTRATGPQLHGAMGWLHFDPAVVLALLRHRGGQLGWFSQETGRLGATHMGVHFGLNALGHLTVFAKDIGGLAPWEQRVWSAHSISPEGGTSEELFAAQMEVQPAATRAPEQDLQDVLGAVDTAFLAKHGQPLLREDASVMTLLKRAHRFVALDGEGLLELAKELTRLFMERVDVGAIGSVVTFAKADKRPGSLKALEQLIAHHRDAASASAMMAPLFGIYDLRLADAHLGSSKIESGKVRAKVVESDPRVVQGRQLIQAFTDTLRAIADVLA
jgi:hypothetical protein